MKKIIVMMLSLLGCGFSTVYTMQRSCDIYVIKTMVLDAVESNKDKEGIQVSPSKVLEKSDTLDLVAECAKQKKINYVSYNIARPNDQNDDLLAQYGRIRGIYALNELDQMRSDIQKYTVAVGMRKLPGARKDSFATEFSGELILTPRSVAEIASVRNIGNKVARNLEIEFGVSPITVDIRM